MLSSLSLPLCLNFLPKFWEPACVLLHLLGTLKVWAPLLMVKPNATQIQCK